MSFRISHNVLNQFKPSSASLTRARSATFNLKNKSNLFREFDSVRVRWCGQNLATAWPAGGVFRKRLSSSRVNWPDSNQGTKIQQGRLTLQAVLIIYLNVRRVQKQSNQAISTNSIPTLNHQAPWQRMLSIPKRRLSEKRVLIMTIFRKGYSLTISTHMQSRTMTDAYVWSKFSRDLRVPSITMNLQHTWKQLVQTKRQRCSHRPPKTSVLLSSGQRLDRRSRSRDEFPFRALRAWRR